MSICCSEAKLPIFVLSGELPSLQVVIAASAFRKVMLLAQRLLKDTFEAQENMKEIADGELSPQQKLLQETLTEEELRAQVRTVAVPPH